MANLRQRPPASTILEMVDAYVNHFWSIEEIAGDFGLSASNVRKTLLEEGVTMRTRKEAWAAKRRVRKVWKDAG